MIMFTGIITHLGKLTEKNNTKYTFSAPKTLCNSISKGTSISVNGVCLTVFNKTGNASFSVEIMPETARKTMLKSLKTDGFVNLELPLTSKSFISGHLVSGHVDGVGLIKKIIKEGNSKLFTIQFPDKLDKYIVKKGSISVNGISLTVINVQKYYFTVGIIPYTEKHTMLHTANIGNEVNLEVDIIAKYLEKLI